MAAKLTSTARSPPAVDLITQAVGEGRRMAGHRPLETLPSSLPNLPFIYVYQDRVLQAILGLFSHAIHATERGTIRLIARQSPESPSPRRPHLIIDVIDQGAGIREADQAALFEAFREIQDPSGRRIGGLGLGLALARALIRAHGGDVGSPPKGTGTTFTVALPCTHARPRHAKPPPVE